MELGFKSELGGSRGVAGVAMTVQQGQGRQAAHARLRVRCRAGISMYGWFRKPPATLAWHDSAGAHSM